MCLVLLIDTFLITNEQVVFALTPSWSVVALVKLGAKEEQVPYSSLSYTWSLSDRLLVSPVQGVYQLSLLRAK